MLKTTIGPEAICFSIVARRVAIVRTEVRRADENLAVAETLTARDMHRQRKARRSVRFEVTRFRASNSAAARATTLCWPVAERPIGAWGGGWVRC